MTFDLERMLSYLPDLLPATLITIELTLLSITLASVLGLIIAIMRLSHIKVLRFIGTAFVEIIRNTPDLVQIYYIFYVLPAAGIRLSPLLAGVIALTIHFGAYLSEVFRAGILSVDKSQWEAALALNMPMPLTLRRIILPQAFRLVLPSWANYFIGMFKSTSLVSAVAVQELLYKAKAIGAYNFRYYELFAVVAVIYFLICYPSSLIVRRLEKRRAALT